MRTYLSSLCGKLYPKICKGRPLTLPGAVLIAALDEQVSGALGAQREQDETEDGRHGVEGEHHRPQRPRAYTRNNT